MKDYKVGDTIYAKGTVRVIDDDDKKLPYYVDFGNTGWIPSDNIIDELPAAEPVKPVLPKNVADELEKAKNNILNFYGYLDSTLPLMNSFVFGHLSDRDARIKILSDAWYNGYTIEKEKKFLVKIPHVIGGIYRKTTTTIADSPVTTSHRNEWLNIDKEFKSRYEFTDEEINKFDLQDCEKEPVADD